MDFDRYLCRVQTSLKCIEKSMETKFVDITRAENEEELVSISESFASLLKGLEPGEDDLRHINLYLLINTDLLCLQQLHSDVDYCHLVDTLPPLSTVLYFHLMTATPLHRYVGEVISFCPNVLVVDLLRCIKVNLDYTRPEIVIDFLDIILEALFKKIMWFKQRETPESVKQTLIKILLSLVNDFSIFDIMEKTKWPLLKTQCFYGRYIKMLLNLVERCVNMFNTDPPLEDMDLYKMDIKFDYNQWPALNNQLNFFTFSLEQLIRLTESSFKKVSTLIYMAWCEEDYDGGPDTLQRAVREAAYTCRQALTTLTKYEGEITSLREVIEGLDKVAVKPKCEDDEFQGATTDTIVKNMKNPNKTRIKWLRNYLNIDNILLENRCLDDLRCVSDIFTKETTLQLIRTFVKHSNNNEIPDKLDQPYKVMILKCVKQLRTDEQIDILNEVASQGDDTLKTKDFNHNVTQTFNKLVNNSDQMEKVMVDVISVALECGREVVRLLLSDCLKATSLCDLLIQPLLEIPLLTKFTCSPSDSTPLCQQCVVTHFDNALTSSSDITNLAYLIKKLSWFSVIDGKDFVIRHLIPVIQRSVPDKKWKDINLCLDILEVFIDGSGGDQAMVCDAEIIAFLAQLLNRSRVQPPQFTVHSADVVQKTSTFLFLLTNHFLQRKNGKTEKEACWLREISKSVSPLAWFPMRKLWTGTDLPPDPQNQLTWSKQFLGRTDLLTLSGQDRSSFVIHLCKVLPLLSLSEWKMIGFDMGGSERAPQCVAVFHILADCLLVLNQLPAVRGNSYCVAHLVTGFTTFFKTKAVHSFKHSDRSTCLEGMHKAVILANELSPDVLKARLAALSCLLQEMSGLILDKANKDQHQSDLLTVISDLRDTQIQSMLSNTLLKSLTT